MYGSPEEIRLLAARVRTAAGLTRSDAGRGNIADAVVWKSLAAQKYREKLAEALQQVQGVAGELDSLSTTLMEHAAAVQHRLEEIAAAERWLRGQAERAAREARDLDQAAVDLAGNVAGEVRGLVSGSLGWAQRQGEELAGAAWHRADDLGRQVQQLPGGDQGWLTAARARGWAG